MVTLPINANKYARQNVMGEDVNEQASVQENPQNKYRFHSIAVIPDHHGILDKQEYFLLSCFIKVIPDEHKQ